MLLELALHIENSIASSYSLELQTNFFIGSFPVGAPDICVAILERGGVFDEYLPNHRIADIQILVRDPNYTEGRDLANSIFEELVDKYGVISLDGYKVEAVVGMNPGWIGQDEKKRNVFSININYRIYKEIG